MEREVWTESVLPKLKLVTERDVNRVQQKRKVAGRANLAMYDELNLSEHGTHRKDRVHARTPQ